MRWWPRKQVYLDDLPRTHDFRFAMLFIMLFVAVIAAVYAVGYLVAGDRLANGTTIAGVDVGGMRRDEARTTLQEELVPRLEEPITVTAVGQTFEVDPQTAGVTLDLESSVDAGLGSSAWDPSHMLEVVTGGESHDAVMDLDETEFQTLVDGLAASVERPAKDAVITFAGGPTFKPGVEGVEIDRLAFARELKAAVLAEDHAVEIPVRAVEPAVTTTEASDFVSEIAQPAVSDDVRVRVGDTVLRVEPAVFGSALQAEPVADGLELAVDADALFTRSQALLGALPDKPVNARFEFRDGRPVVVPSRPGTTVSSEDWAAAVLAAASKAGDERRAAAKVTPAPPRLSTNAARQLEITTRVGIADVRLPSGTDLTAATRAARQLDGALTPPQQNLSVLQQTSDVAQPELTAVASALFDASFRTGIAIVTRQAPAAHRVGEAGLDAAAAPGVDLVVSNDTPYGILVRSAVIGGPGRSQLARVELWGAEYWDVSVSSGARYDVTRPRVERRSGPACRPQPGRQGFSIDVSRTIAADGVGSRTETVHSSYRPTDRISCRG